MNFKIGISSCPNDTYIFGALFEGFIKTEHSFDVFMNDIEVLNSKALKKELDIVKVSYGAVPLLLEEYTVLKSGGALGFGCGPLVVAKEQGSVESLRGQKIAIPGRHTSAFRFFRHFFGDGYDFVELRFDMIMPAVLTGQAAAGVVIHEGRFVYEQMGLGKLCDLGELWEERYKSPVPLGAILLKRSISDYAAEINFLIRESITFADNNYEKIEHYIKKHAQELDDKVIKSHIELYVNEYSKDLTPAVEGLCRFLECGESDFT
jgi:1,4-dihydroxy-6-naphthoate synthase